MAVAEGAMGKGGKTSGPEAPGPFHGAFAGLAGLREALPPGEAPAPVAATREEAAPGPSRAIVRLERKGRGGKEVTRLELRGLAPTALPDWLRDVKRALGCGGAVEDEMLVLQGDQRERLRGWLVERGVRQVTVG